MTVQHADPTSATVLHLLGGPRLVVCGRAMSIPEGSGRLVVLLALRRRRVDRRTVAETLWPDCEEQRAAGNLRSALWRLRRVGGPLVAGDRSSLGLQSDIALDTAAVDAWTARLIAGTIHIDDLDIARLPWDALDLLPGWDDEWVADERRRLRQRVLHGLDALSTELAARGRWGEAVEAAIASISADPFRESARCALIRAYLGEGNRAEAHREFSGFRTLLREEMGIEPSGDFTAMLWPLTPAPATRVHPARSPSLAR